MRVLVLDGNCGAALACVRSLARAGHSVWVGECSSWSKAGWSRSCNGTFTYPDPQQDVDSFVQRIAQQVRQERGTLVLPMADRTTLLLSAHRDSILAAGGRTVLPPHASLLRAFDKLATNRLAESLGIAVPRTALIGNSAQAREAARGLRYPMVLKPRTSHEVSSLGRARATGPPAYARNPREFTTAYSELSRRCSSVLGQEFVDGTGIGYSALLRLGQPRLEFAHQRIRDMRPSGSGSSVRVSIDPDPEVRGAALAILQALAWHGVAMVEFRQRPDGTPVFLEVNGRFWGSLALAVFAGADFPALLARMAEKGDVEDPARYRAGVRCRWLLGDFRHLLHAWRGAPPGYPGKFPGRLRSVLTFLLPVPGTLHDSFSLRDPLPEVADWLNFALWQLAVAARNLCRVIKTSMRNLRKLAKKPPFEERHA